MTTAQTCKKCAVGACSCAAGLALGHAGCLVASAIALTTGAGIISLHSVFTLAFCTLAAVVGFFIWSKQRAHVAQPWERRFVSTGIISGVAVTAGLHFGYNYGAESAQHVLSWCGNLPASFQQYIPVK